MEALFNSIEFETKTGGLRITKASTGIWSYEWYSGYSNGLHNPTPFKSFDSAYSAMKKALANEIKNMRYE
jgi:hypothetical protein